MSYYAEPASQRELTDGRERARTSRKAPVSQTPGHDAYVRALLTAPPRDSTISVTRRLLDDDAHAAYMVAACVSCVQSGNETRPAFVKRLVRAWIDEMGRVEARP